MNKIEFFNSLPEEGKAIRFKVFVEEQGFQNELDDIDNTALHLVLYVDGAPAGAARMFTEDGGKAYHLGRIAVLPEFRGLHLGAMIVEEMCKKAKELGAERCELSAQCRAMEFYKKQGFQEQGDVYLDEYCPPHLYGKKLMNMKIIARIYNDFPTKFGIPRQSGRVKKITGKIVFEKEFRNDEALRGIEQFSHLWLIWEFSENIKEDWSPTVRPPRLGGNKRIGVFASRSPFRPNPIGVSCVKLERVEKTENEGTVLIVSSADLMNGTPIYDIKPYIPYADSIIGAKGGYAEEHSGDKAEVIISDELLERLPFEKRIPLIEVLRDDPRPAYQHDDERIYGFPFSDFEIKFKAKENKIIVTDIIKYI